MKIYLSIYSINFRVIDLILFELNKSNFETKSPVFHNKIRDSERTNFKLFSFNFTYFKKYWDPYKRTFLVLHKTHNKGKLKNKY
ncbi:hypothetical protein BpHYR1_001815 [Brachionus plicatilis]|uniref:Uncharacterized protein n=1 Tax=Brachionus plicatilis TaxID=10195 RepID=A0A3M7PRM1_BRAPC|nr:hypothetical protein BpHYR1_001815 [Brachionus plicatilis]